MQNLSEIMRREMLWRERQEKGFHGGERRREEIMGKASSGKLKVVKFKINKLFTFIAMGFRGISEIVPVDSARVIGRLSEDLKHIGGERGKQLGVGGRFVDLLKHVGFVLTRNCEQVVCSS
jgi:hypothetical protein